MGIPGLPLQGARNILLGGGPPQPGQDTEASSWTYVLGPEGRKCIRAV
jgi:hypothetical protein